MKIKKGQRFMCIKDYVMEDGWIAYFEGKEYICYEDNCLTDEQNDSHHKMNNETDFNEHFEEIVL